MPAKKKVAVKKQVATKKAAATEVSSVKTRRGPARSPKAVTAVAAGTTTPKRRGRPPKKATGVTASAPKRRGRPPKSTSVKTTRVTRAASTTSVKRANTSATARAVLAKQVDQKNKWRMVAKTAQDALVSSRKEVLGLERKLGLLQKMLESVMSARDTAVRQFSMKWEKDYMNALQKKVAVITSKRRGRPAKAKTVAAVTASTAKRRGRPPKSASAEKPTASAAAAPKRRGPVPKAKAPAAATSAPKRRGRPPKKKA